MQQLLDRTTEALCQYLENSLPRLSENWLRERVTPALMGDTGRRRIAALSELDLPALVRVFLWNWRPICDVRNLPPEVKCHLDELKIVRNNWAHRPPGMQFPQEDINRACDTAYRLARAIDADKELVDWFREQLRNRVYIEPQGAVRGGTSVSSTIAKSPPSSVPRHLAKSEAINAMSRHYTTEVLTNKNVTFANVNSAIDVWWMEIAYRVFESEAASRKNHNILVYDHRTGELHLLTVPTEYLRENKDRFTRREDKKSIGLQLAINEPNLFRNVAPVDSGVEFGSYKIESVKFPTRV